MTDQHRFDSHWLDIESERMELYEEMFQWNPASEVYYAAARIGDGQIVGDYGCGPGHAAIEFARRVGPEGRVHAFDINAEFVRRTRERADANGLGDRITAHLMEEPRLTLPDGSVDRMVARNTIIYVPDPVYTFAEFRRVLRSGGIAHAIEGDWGMTAVEPIPTGEWQALVEAASWAWPHPEIGRRLYGIAREAGFDDVSLQVLTGPDTNGRLGGMIRTVAGYARDGGRMDAGRIDALLRSVEEATAKGAYLAIAPQFVVTATA